mmetsp:Transcript_44747/g.80309  ORF Transcript_44747/g.80309 Transcript_44747/m.80309 type:complete len:553 (-) Transcript_44747:101-1759(-)
MMDRVQAVLKAAIESSGLELSAIDSVEMVGGGSRVPWVKRLCNQAFGKELSTTMNQEESVARGCALQAAMLSPLYKVREFDVKDCSPFSVGLRWTSDGTEQKHAIFPARSPMNMVKLLTFYRTKPFQLTAELSPDGLLPNTDLALGCYEVDLPVQTEAKKVKVKAKLTLHGTFDIESAQMIEEEEYEEVVKERRELPKETNGKETAKEDAEEANTNEGKEGREGKDGNDEEKDKDGDVPMPSKEDTAKEDEEAMEAEEPQFEWVDVVKKKTRSKRTDLKISVSGKPGLSAEILQLRQDEETAMQADMREIIETDERKNDLEGYIFTTRSKVSDGEWADFVAPADREGFLASLQRAEDWLYDAYDGTKIQFIEKLDELKSVGDLIQWRHKEAGARPDWVKALTGTIVNYRNAAESPGEKYGHISEAKLGTILTACSELEAWLKEKATQQEALPKHQKPVLTCADMDKKNQDLAKLCDEILKEPKPKKEKVKEKEKEETEKEMGEDEEQKENLENQENKENRESNENKTEQKETARENGDNPEVQDEPQNMDVD